MADIWLQPDALVNLLGVGYRAVMKAIAANKYTTREVPGGRGGKGGVRYEVLLSSLPEKAQAQYQKSLEAGIAEKVTGHLSQIAENQGLKPANTELAVPENPLMVLPETPKAIGYVKEKTVLQKPNQRDKDRAAGTAKIGLVLAMQQLAAELGLSTRKAAEIMAARLASPDCPADWKTLFATAKRGSKENASERSLQRWAGLYAQGIAEGDALKYLVPGRKLELDWHIVPWAAAVLARWQNPNKPELAQVVRTVRKDLIAAGWQEGDIPNYDQARRWLGKLPLRVRERRRNSGAALKALLPFIRRDWSSLQSNDVWVGDGHTFKAKVCHPDHGRPFAPEVTFVICAASRFIVGWAVSLAENTIAVAEAIGKGMVNHGRPLIYYSDNGAGQTAKFLDADLVGILPRFGVRHETGIAGNPQGRGIIERLWASTLIRLAKEYPTFQGRDADPETLRKTVRDINSARTKNQVPEYVPSWNQFVDDVAKCVKEYNFEHIHRELGMTPAQAYTEKLAADSVMKLTDHEIEEVFRPEVLRIVQRGQVSVFRNQYFSKGLEDWNGKSVRVLFDFADASKVWVRDMQGRLLATALFEGNKRDGFDKPLMQQLAEQRVERAVNSLADKQAEKRLELSETVEGEVIHVINLREIAQGEAILAAEAARKPQQDADKQAEQHGEEILKAEATRPKPRTVEELFEEVEGEWSEIPAKQPEISPKTQRPNFMDDYSQLVWLSENRAEITAADQEWMRETMQISTEFKALHQELFGVTTPNKAALG